MTTAILFPKFRVCVSAFAPAVMHMLHEQSMTVLTLTCLSKRKKESASQRAKFTFLFLSCMAALVCDYSV